MERISKKARIQQTELKLRQFRKQNIQRLYEHQIGMIDSWMRDSTEPYADWEFDDLNLYIYIALEDSTATKTDSPYRLETYTLSDLAECIHGFAEVVDELKMLNYYEEVNA